jgi:lipopolysaccharide export system protein LptA
MRSFLTVIVFFLLAIHLNAQEVTDTTAATQVVEILPGTKTQMFRKLPDGTELQILSGTVRLKQGRSFFYCDSLVMNSLSKVFEAFGHVHINDSDTTDLYSDHLRYLTDTRYAYLDGHVRLSDGHATLTTNELEYDVANKIGIYKNGGRVINKKSVLTSRQAEYYSDTRDVFFKTNVELKDPAYYMKTDSMIYNTETQVARFVTETYIRDSSGRTIRTKEGTYDQHAGHAEFTQRTTITDKDVTIVGDQIASDDAAGIAQVRGNGILIDKKNGVTILANEIFANKKTEAYLATRKPLMIIKQESDSIYVAADTLFTARLSDRFKTVDTSLKKTAVTKKKNEPAKTDSTDRYFEAFRHVRVFSDSVQSVSDSLFYSFKDSTFRLYQDPVVWSKKNQITGDTIFLYTKNKKASRFRVFEHSFLVNELQPDIYNQVRATRMDGFFKEGVIDSVRAKGFAESVYFLQDKDSAYTGANQTTSDAMDVYFTKGDLRKVVFRSAVKGTLWPISHKSPADLRLKDFEWLDARRPKTKYELFE